MMIKVYVLPVERINDTDTVKGIEHIHNALLTYDYRKATLIQDTTPEEDGALSNVAIEVREPTEQERVTFSTLPIG